MPRYGPPVRDGGRMGRGRTGVGDRFSRARLLLAQRAGFVPPGMLPRGAGQSSAMWRDASKNLAARAHEAGFQNPIQWLREMASERAMQRHQAPEENIGVAPLGAGGAAGAAGGGMPMGGVDPSMIREAAGRFQQPQGAGAGPEQLMALMQQFNSMENAGMPNSGGITRALAGPNFQGMAQNIMGQLNPRSGDPGLGTLADYFPEGNDPREVLRTALKRRRGRGPGVQGRGRGRGQVMRSQVRRRR